MEHTFYENEFNDRNYAPTTTTTPAYITTTVVDGKNSTINNTTTQELLPVDYAMFWVAGLVALSIVMLCGIAMACVSRGRHRQQIVVYNIGNNNTSNNTSSDRSSLSK